MSGRAAPIRSPPLALQMLGLILGGLVAAQAATFAMSTLMPPPPAPQYSLRSIALALRGGPLALGGLPRLQRDSQARAPDPRSPGWQVSEPARRELAGQLGVDPSDVELLFYSPPPFAGAGAGQASTETRGMSNPFAELLAEKAWAGPPGGGGGPGGGPPGPGGFPGGAPGGGFPGQADQPQGPAGSPRGSGQRGGGQSGGGSGSGGPQHAGGAGPGGSVFDPPVAPVPQGAPDAESSYSQARAPGGGLGASLGGGFPGAPGEGPAGRGQPNIQPGYPTIFGPSVGDALLGSRLQTTSYAQSLICNSLT